MKKNLILNKNTYVFLICVAVATLFWFLNAFSKTYHTVIEIPIKYIEMPKNKVVINTPPTSLVLKVVADGFNLVNPIKGDFDTLYVSGNNLIRRRQIEADSWYMPTKSLINDVAAQIKKAVKIEEVLTDSMYFDFDKEVMRTVLVKPDLQVTFERQYNYADEVELAPQSVRIKGPKGMLDTMTRVMTTPIVFDDLNESQTIQVNFEYSNDPRLTFKPASAILRIPVEKYTEGVKMIPIEVINCPDSFALKVFPNEIEVKYLVGLGKLDKVVAGGFSCVVDYSDIVSGVEKIKAKVVGHPNFIELVSQSPLKVEYHKKRVKL